MSKLEELGKRLELIKTTVMKAEGEQAQLDQQKKAYEERFKENGFNPESIEAELEELQQKLKNDYKTLEESISSLEKTMKE